MLLVLGLRDILEQKIDDEWYPIAYVSRSLMSALQNYCQLKRETLSILFACSKFLSRYSLDDNTPEISDTEM